MIFLSAEIKQLCASLYAELLKSESLSNWD